MASNLRIKLTKDLKRRKAVKGIEEKVINLQLGQTILKLKGRSQIIGDLEVALIEDH